MACLPVPIGNFFLIKLGGVRLEKTGFVLYSQLISIYILVDRFITWTLVGIYNGKIIFTHVLCNMVEANGLV